jgi:glucan biosynthesis protein C
MQNSLNSTTNRLRFVDTTRALLLVLGVVFHSVLPFEEGKQWVVSNPESLSGVRELTEWIHSFRMHGFFLISGLVSWQVLKKYGGASFLQMRLQRLIVPFVTVLLTINMIERSLILRHHAVWGWGYSSVEMLRVGSLWFLAYLAIFTLILPVVRIVVASLGVTRHIERWSPTQIELALPIIVALGSSLIVILTRTSPDWWYSVQLGFIEPVGVLMYGGYFMVGVMLSRTGQSVVLTTKPTSIWWLAAIVGWIVIQLVANTPIRGAWLLSSILRNVYAIVVLRLIFWGVGTLRNRWDRELVDASYTVYLLHHIVVIIIASSLASISLPPLLKLLAILAAALLVPFGFHRFVVLKSPWLAFALNGTPIEKR